MERLFQKIALYCGIFSLLFLHLAGEANLFEKGVFRLHILANSDSPRDQYVKMQVRNAVLDWAGEAPPESPEELKERLLSEGEELLHCVEQALQREGASYGARLAMGIYAFPDREYGGLLYPAGDYQALRILLGEGRGQNWWCVMFPPLCILELPGGEIEYEGDAVKFKSLFLNWLKGVNQELWEKVEESLRGWSC